MGVIQRKRNREVTRSLRVKRRRIDYCMLGWEGGVQVGKGVGAGARV